MSLNLWFVSLSFSRLNFFFIIAAYHQKCSIFSKGSVVDSASQSTRALYVGLCLCAFMYKIVDVSIGLFLCVFVSVCAYLCLHCVCMYVIVCVYICLIMCFRLCVCVCLCVYVCVCACVCLKFEVYLFNSTTPNLGVWEHTKYTKSSLHTYIFSSSGNGKFWQIHAISIHCSY